MAKHDAGSQSGDDSVDEVANQFSNSKPRSKNKVASKSRSPSKNNTTRKARKTNEIQVTSEDEEPPKGKSTDEDEDDDEAGEEEEYEIEKILGAEVGAIETNPDDMCYFVRWKGYSKSDDSWTTEDNASGAQDLIKIFWKAEKRSGKPSRQDLLDVHTAKKARKAKKRKSLGTPVVKKPRASRGVDISSEDLGDVASKKSPMKRRRESKSTVMDVDDEPAQDKDEDRRLSKKRKSTVEPDHANGRSASKKKLGGKNAAPQAQSLGIQGDLIEDTMTRYGKLKNWDNLVRAITTVEKREEDSVLQIFWTSTDGFDCLTPSTVFSKKCPQKLIEFYESNLKWRPNDGLETNITPEAPEVPEVEEAMQE